jgi:hypothetical protein
MPSLDIPQIAHTNPPPAHTPPGRVEVNPDRFSITNRFFDFKKKEKTPAVHLPPGFGKEEFAN